MASTALRPRQAAAAHPGWPEARFNLSGLFVLDGLILQARHHARERFDFALPIDSVHGAPAVPWNGGRRSHAFPSVGGMERGVQLLNAEGIGVFFTFTNHLLEAQHLQDATCNHLLELIDNASGLNGVILASDRLTEHVAQRHPRLRRYASAVKTTMERVRDAAGYRALAQRYHRVVLHPDDGVNAELVSQLDPSRFEVLLNEPCVRGCPSRERHYELLAQLQLAGRYDLELEEANRHHERSVCRMPLRVPGERRRDANLDGDEVRALYRLGFRHFKLQGRTDVAANFAYDLTRYLVEPDVVGPGLFKALMASLSAPSSAS